MEFTCRIHAQSSVQGSQPSWHPRLWRRGTWVLGRAQFSKKRLCALAQGIPCWLRLSEFRTNQTKSRRTMCHLEPLLLLRLPCEPRNLHRVLEGEPLRPGQRAAQGRAMCAERPLGSVRLLPDPLSASPGVTARRDRPRCAPRAPGTNRVGSRGLSATAQEKRKKPAVPASGSFRVAGGPRPLLLRSACAPADGALLSPAPLQPRLRHKPAPPGRRAAARDAGTKGPRPRQQGTLRNSSMAKISD